MSIRDIFYKKVNELLNKLNIKTKCVKSNNDIQESKNVSAILKDRNEWKMSNTEDRLLEFRNKRWLLIFIKWN